MRPNPDFPALLNLLYLGGIGLPLEYVGLRGGVASAITHKPGIGIGIVIGGHSVPGPGLPGLTTLRYRERPLVVAFDSE